MMKHLFILLFATLLFSTCKNGPKATADSNAATANLTSGDNKITETVLAVDSITGGVRERERPLNALSTAIGKTTSKTIDPIKPKEYYMKATTLEHQEVVKHVTNNYWAVWALHRTNDPSNEENQGTWFKFFPDGKYEYGHFEKRVGKGTWFIDWTKPTIMLDSELLGDDREWTIKMGKGGEVMVWIGTDRYFTMDIQMKLVNLLAIPKVKKDLGLE